MKKITIILMALFTNFLFISCQKAKDPEGKKEAQVQQQMEEVKQPAEANTEAQPQKQITEIKAKPLPEKQPPQPVTAKEESPQTVSATERETQFKEPVLLWEREFDPPIREISDQNSSGDFLAIQVKKEEGSGRPLMTKLLVIDSKGRTKREELLPEKKKVSVPAEQLWLTALSDEELGQLKKAKKPKEVDAWGREMYISGNGEYYATVMQYGGWYEFTYKDKNGKTLWKITPKDNYGFHKAYISYDGSKIVIIDMGGLGGGDAWEVLGQRVYFYDGTGKLLKDYDLGERMEEWIDVVRFSIDSKYIGILSKRVADKTTFKLLANNTNLLWNRVLEKDFFFISINDGISRDGYLILEGKDKLHSFDRAGNMLWEKSSPKSRFCWRPTLSPDGKYVFVAEDEVFFIYDNKSGEEILKITMNELLNIEDIYSAWLRCGTFSSKGKYILFPFAYLQKKYVKTSQEKENMFEKKRISYTNEELETLYSVAVFSLEEKKFYGL